jgi:hypothetical protein
MIHVKKEIEIEMPKSSPPPQFFNIKGLTPFPLVAF